MLNMVNLDQYFSNNSEGVNILHVVFVFIVSILMINFLIALFSTSYAEVYANRRIYQFVQKLLVTTTIEGRLMRFVPAWYKWQRPRCFLTTKDGKILLRRVVLRDQCTLIEKKYELGYEN